MTRCVAARQMGQLSARIVTPGASRICEIRPKPLIVVRPVTPKSENPGPQFSTTLLLCRLSPPYSSHLVGASGSLYQLRPPICPASLPLFRPPVPSGVASSTHPAPSGVEVGCMATPTTRSIGTETEVGNSDPECPVPLLLLVTPSVVSAPPRPHSISRGSQRRLLESLFASPSGVGRSAEPWSEDLERSHFMSSSESLEEG